MHNFVRFFFIRFVSSSLKIFAWDVFFFLVRFICSLSVIIDVVVGCKVRLMANEIFFSQMRKVGRARTHSHSIDRLKFDVAKATSSKQKLFDAPIRLITSNALREFRRIWPYTKRKTKTSARNKNRHDRFIRIHCICPCPLENGNEIETESVEPIPWLAKKSLSICSADSNFDAAAM